MTISWSWNDWEPDTPYEADLRRAERERMSEGWEPMEGWRRPTDPMCPVHNFGLVRGLCGLCVQELEAQERAA